MDAAPASALPPPTPAPRTRRRLLVALAALAALVGAYAWFGQAVVPGIVRDQATGAVRRLYDRELAIGAIRFEPFRLRLTVRDIALPDTDGTPMLSLDGLVVDFEVASLWRRAFVFRELRLEAPAVTAIDRDDGLNVAILGAPRTADEPAAAEDAPASLPALWIHTLAVDGGRAVYEDRRRGAPPRRAEFAPVRFVLTEFRSTPAGGGFRLDAASDTAGELHWEGHLALAPRLRSDGRFQVRALRLARAAGWAGGLPLRVSDGELALDGSYRFALDGTATLDVDVPEIRVSSLALGANGVAEDWVRLPTLTVSGTTLSLAQRRVAIASVAAEGLGVTAWLEPDGGVNLAQLLPVPTAGGAAAASTTTRPTTPTATGAVAAAPAWTLDVGAVSLQSASIDFEDRLAPPAKRWRVAPLAITAGPLGLDLARPVPATLVATINDRAKLTVSGSVTPAPFATRVDVSLADAYLPMLQPYLPPQAGLALRDGTLAVSGQLEIAAEPRRPRTPALQFAGDVRVDRFASTDTALGQPLASFAQLSLATLRYRQSPDELRIDRVTLREPFARVIVGTDGRLNLARLGGGGEDAAKVPAATPASVPDPATSPVPASTSSPAATYVLPLPVAIREFAIERGRLDFTDLFIQPNFAAEIGALGGTVRDLSSRVDARAAVDLRGQLGEFSPVTIAGTVQAFAFDRHTDLRLRFDNISLPVFNPYSGQFAGYSIAKGKLTTDLGYRITDRKLDASHHIRIDQLEWGEASATRGAATLPVRFATSLLKDRHGVIDLDVPVKGTLDDPTFRVGPIVWQVIRNLVVKAATAPFALLGSLFGGGEDAQFVDFAPGSAELAPAAAERLANLAKGLAERPAVAVDVPIAVLAGPDGAALAARRHADALAAATRATAAADAGAPAPDYAALTPKQRQDVLRRLLKEAGVAVPPAPEPAPVPEGTSREQARALREEALVAFLEPLARGAFTATDLDLSQLGEARAEVIQRALLAGGALEPARVFLVRDGKVSAQDGAVRCELALR